jgi:hypothetical protein
MNHIDYSIGTQGARPPEVNVEVHEKPVDSFAADKAKDAVKVAKPHQAVREQREEKLDTWMENIKEFIRNIDVKSL